MLLLAASRRRQASTEARGSGLYQKVAGRREFVPPLRGPVPLARLNQEGCRLGPYEVVSAIRARGMGEVYRARDTRLEPIVATQDQESVVYEGEFKESSKGV